MEKETVNLYMSKFGIQDTERNRLTTIYSLNNYVKGGVSEKVITRIINFSKNPKDFVSWMEKYKTTNIINPDEFYYHPELQVTPPAPKKYYDDDLNLITEPYTFKLEIKDHYSFEKMLDYLYKRFPYLPDNKKKDIASLEYVYKHHMVPKIYAVGDPKLKALDLMLFTIDEASALTYDKDKKIQNSLDIADFIDKGLDLYQDKKNMCVEEGIDHVI